MNEVLRKLKTIIHALFIDGRGRHVSLSVSQVKIVYDIMYLVHKRMCIAAYTGFGKCMSKGTPILMYDGSIKKVEEIKVGDELMGDDSTSRNVLSLARGVEEMYKVHQINGDDYVVNKSHILSLVMNHNRQHPVTKKVLKKGEVVDISVKDYLLAPKSFTHCAKGYKSRVDWKSKKVKIDPYFLGLWLGDGLKNSSSICSADKEIINYVKKYSEDLEMDLSIWVDKRNSNSNVYHIGNKGSSNNNLLKLFKEYNLQNNKHIPKNYLINDRKIRLSVLAGLIDSDGSMNKNCVDIIQKRKELSEQIVFLARSLGFRVSMKECKKSIKKIGFTGTYYRITISGNTDEIPVLIERKKCSKRSINKDPLRCGISLESEGVGDYYGFTLDGNHRYLLSDFTVTHNTFATSIALLMCARRNKGIKINNLSISKEQGNLCYDYILEFISRQPVFHKYVKSARGHDLKHLRNALNRDEMTLSFAEEGQPTKMSIIRVLTANLNQSGKSLLGHHCDLLLEDESAEIPDDLERVKVRRMLEEGPNDAFPKMHVKISTTHHRGHFRDWVLDAAIKTYIVDVEVGIVEGRIGREYVDSRRAEMTEREFNVWYMCKFPKQDDFNFFSDEEIDKVLEEFKVENKDWLNTGYVKCLGIDPAGFGPDKTVFTLTMVKGNDFVSKVPLLEGKSMFYSRTSVDDVKGLAIKIIDIVRPKFVVVDAIGLGAGVASGLRSQYKDDKKVMVFSFKAGNKPKYDSNKRDYYNIASACFGFCQKMINEGFMHYVDNGYIRKELEQIEYEYAGSKMIHVNKKGNQYDSDKHSPDFCFVGDTMVLTSKGYIMIKNVKVGDFVVTPFGFKKVINKGERFVNKIVELGLKNGKTLKCTPKHKIFTINGFKYAKDVINTDTLSYDNLFELIKWRIKKLLNTKAGIIGFRAMVNTTTMMCIQEMEKKEDIKKHYTEKYGKTLIIKQFLKDILSITLMEIPTIIILKILNYVKEVYTKVNTWKKDLKTQSIKYFLKKLWRKLKLKQKNGIKAQKEENGTKNIGMKVLEKLNQLLKNVFGVKKNIQLNLINQEQSIVVKNVVRNSIKVYNITVEDDQVYYANGVLVSNCDSWVMSLFPWVERTFIKMVEFEDKEINHFKY